MYWGNSLLGLVDTIAGLADMLKEVVYHAGAFLWSIIYHVWHLIAWLVSGVEGVFRNLAGIGSTNTDMVSVIINNSKVQQIFGNLVGLSIALIVFFTIVKIIQEHYKEKDGGNPYKVVLRTFQGLLMFFFVTAAVSVGVYASQIMFKALDAATSSGSSSIAGQVFKAMAADANRKKIGVVTSGLTADARNKYYYRLTDGTDATNGRYFVTTMTGNAPSSQSELAAAYADAFPYWQYEVINADGTTTPIVNWLTSQGYSLDTQNFEKYAGKSKGEIQEFENGKAGASVGYANDFLRSVDVEVTPSIDLTWSPIDITDFGYYLKETNKIQHDVNVTVWGTGINIGMSTQFGKYFSSGERVQKSLEDSAKVFGISVNGKVALQNGEALAAASLEMFDPSQFNNILKTILLNVVFTNVFERMVQAIPSFPMETSVGPVALNFVSIFGNIVSIILDGLVESLAGKLMPRDSNGNLTATPFLAGATSYNGGVWSTMNLDSRTFDIMIEQYRIDGNFTDLWGQLMGTYRDFLAMLEEEAGTAYEHALEQMDEIKNLTNRINQQQDYLAYKAKVDEYNKIALGKLTTLGNMLELWDLTQSDSPGMFDKNSFISARGYNGSFDKLEEDIISTWTSLVSAYNSMIDGQKPTNMYADPRITYPVYKPIVEFNMTDKQATSSYFTGDNGVVGIRKALANNADSGIGSVVTNLLIDDRGVLSSTPSVYRMVDWGAYGIQYRSSNLKNYADIYATSEYINSLSSDAKGGKVLLNNPSIVKLAYGSMETTDYTTWNERGGILNLVSSSQISDNSKNSFYAHSTSAGAQVSYALKDNGYWATDGIHVDNDLYEFYYEGTTLLGTFSTNISGSSSTGSVTPANTVRTSSANENASMSAFAEDQSELHELLTMNTDSELANQFAQNIIKFHKIGTAADEEINVLKTWVGTSPSCEPLAQHEEKMLTTMDADAIDDLMSGNTSTSRQYIMLTKANTTDAANTSNWGEVVGRASWTDASAVKALYEFGEMNYLMGFIAIISAVGVYLNFTFGLIQRAVNMAVLYIMSPVTIAFYPFDNGQRFKSSFVQPFYKEAISAYAVIISLNLFIVLMGPVRTAAATAVGGGIIGTLVGFLALVAFISMLPKIRDSICSILGAGSMSSQSLADTFNNTKKSLKSAVGDFTSLGKAGKNAAKKAAHGVDKVAQWKARNDIRKKDRQKEQLADLQAKAATGELSWWGERRLNKLTKGAAAQAKYAESQKRIDEARASGDTSKLSKAEIKRMERQNTAAERKAAAELRAQGIYKGSAGYYDKLREKKNDLLNDDKFKKNAGLTVAQKAGSKAASIAKKGGKLVAAPAKLVGKGVGLAGRGVAAGAKAVANSGLGRTVRDMAAGVVDSVGNTIVGDAISQTFGKYGTKASDKDSLWGAGMRLFARPDVAKKRLKEEQIKWIKEQQMENDANGPAQKGLSELATGMATKNRKVHAEAVRQAAADTLISSKVSVADKAMALKASEYMRQGKTAEEAKTMAEAYYKDEYIKQAMAGKSDKEIYMAMQTEYRRKNDKMSVKAAKAQAEKDYNGIMSKDNGAELKTWINNLSDEYREAAFGKNFAKDGDFMAAEFTKIGGDGKLIAGMAKGMPGLATFGINFDINSDDTKKTIKAASEKINNLVASGSKDLKLKLDARIQKRQEDLGQSTEAIASGLKLNKAEDIKKVENVLSSAGVNTTQTDIANQIAAKLHLDQNEVAQHVAAAYPNFAQKVQFNNEVQEYQAAFDAASALEKGKREFASKMGPNVNQDEHDQLVKAMMHIYDGDLNSTDPNSLGYQKNKIIQEEFHGDINNPACQAKLNDLQNKMYKAASVMFDDFVAKNRFNIIENDVLQKSSQESSSVYSMSMVKEWERQMEVSATLNLDTQSIGLMFKDNLLKEMKEQGNYTNVGTTIQLAVDSIMKGDEAGLAKLSLEPGSIEQLKQWYAEGDRGIQRLEGLRNYAEFISTHTSNADMGGYDFNAMGAVMSKMLSALEQKIWVERTQSVARSWGDDEARDRFAVDSMMKQFNTLLNAPHWEALCSKIQGLDGKSPTNTEELKATMSSLLSAANNGTNSLEVQNALGKISDLRGQHVGDPAIYEEITRVMNAFASADAANWKSGNVNAVRDLASEINANIARTLVDDQSKLDQDYTK